MCIRDRERKEKREKRKGEGRERETRPPPIEISGYATAIHNLRLKKHIGLAIERSRVRLLTGLLSSNDYGHVPRCTEIHRCRFVILAFRLCLAWSLFDVQVVKWKLLAILARRFATYSCQRWTQMLLTISTQRYWDCLHNLPGLIPVCSE